MPNYIRKLTLLPFSILATAGNSLGGPVIGRWGLLVRAHDEHRFGRLTERFVDYPPAVIPGLEGQAALDDFWVYQLPPISGAGLAVR